MIFLLLVFLPTASAECPEVDAKLAAAESDLVSYFLADAQRALGEVVEGLGCGEPVSAEHLARYWQAQAMIWDFQEDPRADSAFVASKRRGTDFFNADYGAKSRAKWEAVELVETPLNPVVVRGMASDDRVWVDGVEQSEPVAAPGLHLIQVGPELARFSRAVDMPLTGELVVSIPLAASPPEPVPVPLPAAPAPSAADGFVPPYQGVGRLVADSEGRAMSWRKDIYPLARTQSSGREAIRKARLNTVAQVGSLTVAGAGAYATYLFGWELTTGRSADSDGITTALLLSSVVAISGASGRMRLARTRKKQRAAIRDAASQAALLGGSP